MSPELIGPIGIYISFPREGVQALPFPDATLLGASHAGGFVLTTVLEQGGGYEGVGGRS